MCDNSMEFISFSELSQTYGFTVKTLSPHYPKGHGLIEIYCTNNKGNSSNAKMPYLILLSLRASPIKADMKSPVELLNARKYKISVE